MSPVLTKSEIRAVAAERRLRAHAAAPAAGEQLAKVFLRGLVPGPGATVAGYWPFRSEIDPRALMARLRRLGRRIALPVAPPRGADMPLTFRLWEEGRPLRAGHFPVQEPADDSEAVDPDLVLVPLLAFDRTGSRLGYGEGHYDRTLEALKARSPVLAVGLAYAAQEFECVPADPHDQKLDAIATEAAYIRVRKDD